ncbi:MAG TPA: glycerol-3-phosphate acyltransferase [Spirochaetota bacterium]|nr:glycerol-3-phosphate acyltransferase [Spirochaetota bacterium]HPI87714.1 glycerol-3-phosphate acyltransferase [Spirochaetota bacterium]HPR48161.1 glycerol-3-phosphate acyltransferase [Spirochaetota bacterium]
MNELLVYLIGYLAGSVNFSILLFRVMKKDDPRTRFSGNAGVTNVYRQAGMGWAALVLALDMGRSAAVAFLAVCLLSAPAAVWAGLALVAGNRFPVFHGFRGGKGVANYLGFTAFLSPAAAAASCAVWVAVYAVVRVPFVASFIMLAVLAAGTVMFFSSEPPAVAGSLCTVLCIMINHSRNIRDMLENRKKGAHEQQQD